MLMVFSEFFEKCKKIFLDKIYGIFRDYLKKVKRQKEKGKICPGRRRRRQRTMEYPILNKECRMLRWGFVTLGVERLIFGRPQTRYCFAGQFRLLSMPNHRLKS
ncbi:MAG: hypothetical protein CEE38_04765 [Planctomycetes bacterium B3_Pla]|nr:MAG: hypothetical protein CEE38_04765 [Planctomycetes bacterium B3_Pla]